MTTYTDAAQAISDSIAFDHTTVLTAESEPPHEASPSGPTSEPMSETLPGTR